MGTLPLPSGRMRHQTHHVASRPHALDGGYPEKFSGHGTPGRGSTIIELRDEMETDVGIKDDMDLIMLLGNLGADTRSYARESKRARNCLVSEIFSPPRVTKLLSSMPSSKLLPGFAMDLTCIDVDDGLPWDFDIKEKRDKARRLLRAQ